MYTLIYISVYVYLHIRICKCIFAHILIHIRVFTRIIDVVSQCILFLLFAVLTLHMRRGVLLLPSSSSKIHLCICSDNVNMKCNRFGVLCFYVVREYVHRRDYCLNLALCYMGCVGHRPSMGWGRSTTGRYFHNVRFGTCVCADTTLALLSRAEFSQKESFVRY